VTESFHHPSHGDGELLSPGYTVTRWWKAFITHHTLTEGFYHPSHGDGELLSPVTRLTVTDNFCHPWPVSRWRTTFVTRDPSDGEGQLLSPMTHHMVTSSFCHPWPVTRGRTTSVTRDTVTDSFCHPSNGDGNIRNWRWREYCGRWPRSYTKRVE